MKSEDAPSHFVFGGTLKVTPIGVTGVQVPANYNPYKKVQKPRKPQSMAEQILEEQKVKVKKKMDADKRAEKLGENTYLG
eukprot:CAMPEP_0170564360 /NCGR_PEP_ID=MMETSP0211-20121228/72472_1 /TAXON_ID=311385 /ORGANISM="Pseudokeronopsis sp., Strain OXSARD2" /LENGTH=79 /DNA_ID=CAMNT_0010883717 /DNA_START=281 /DNA_END=517 /DNA_ORIENTATION=-